MGQKSPGELENIKTKTAYQNLGVAIYIYHFIQLVFQNQLTQKVNICIITGTLSFLLGSGGWYVDLNYCLRSLAFRLLHFF